jgi:hypothetical protein
VIANDGFYKLALNHHPVTKKFTITEKFLEDFRAAVNARRVSPYEQLYNVLRLDEFR